MQLIKDVKDQLPVDDVGGRNKRNSNTVGILDWTKTAMKTISSTIITGLISLSKTTI